MNRAEQRSDRELQSQTDTDSRITESDKRSDRPVVTPLAILASGVTTGAGWRVRVLGKGEGAG